MCVAVHFQVSISDIANSLTLTNDVTVFDTDLVEMGVKRAEVARMAQMALIDPSGLGNPVPLNYNNVMDLYETCI